MKRKGWNRREVLGGVVLTGAGVALFGTSGASCVAAYAKTTQQESGNSSVSGGGRAASSENQGAAEATMAKNGELYKPGDVVPTSGIYEAIHDKLDGEYHAHPHHVTAMAGTVFPPCRACQGWVRFRLHQAADHVEAHDHFKR